MFILFVRSRFDTGLVPFYIVLFLFKCLDNMSDSDDSAPEEVEYTVSAMFLYTQINVVCIFSVKIESVHEKSRLKRQWSERL